MLASSRFDKKERDPQELESKLSRGNKVESSVPRSDIGLLKLEVLKRRRGKEEKKVSPVDETEDGKVETGKKLQESDTKSRIRAGI